MSEVTETLAQEFDRLVKGMDAQFPHDISGLERLSDFVEEHAAEISAALAAAPAPGGVTVKPLEWGEVNSAHGVWWCARSPFHRLPIEALSMAQREGMDAEHEELVLSLIETTPHPAIPALEQSQKALAFDKIVSARKVFLDANAAYNDRIKLVRAERVKGNWEMRPDREFEAVSEAHAAWNWTCQELADAELAARKVLEGERT